MQRWEPRFRASRDEKRRPGGPRQGLRRAGVLVGLALLAGCVDLNRPPGLGGVTPGDGPGLPDGGGRIDTPGMEAPAPDALIPEPDAPDSDGPDLDGPALDVPAMEAPAVEAPPSDAPAPDAPAPDAPAPDAPAPPLANGQPCSAGAACASGHCVEGVCCDSACGTLCRSCNLASARGTCTLVPAGQDPRNQCPAEAAATCRRAGGCDGAGGCRLHASGVQCAPPTCSGNVEAAPSTCNGSGTCLAGASRPCAPYVCGSTSCRTSCSTAADCQSGHTCTGSACVTIPSVAASLILRWRFDEGSGTVATDSSGSGYHGTYVGESGIPGPSSNVPTTLFANARSRAFNLTSRHAVQLPSTPARLRPAAGFTVSLWFNATTVDSTGADAFNLGTSAYVVRIKSDEIEWVKHVSTTAGSMFDVCERASTAHLDGRWHHLAGVNDGAQMTLYLDGVLQCTRSSTRAPIYSGTDLWVGRNPEALTLDYDGLLDDLRVYDRALSMAEINLLVSGAD